MSTNFNSRNVGTNQRKIKNRSLRIGSLAKKITLSVIMIMTVQCIKNDQLGIPEVFSMGGKTEQKIGETNQGSKFEIRENTPTYEDEFVLVIKQGNKLVINLKKTPDIQTIIARSNFLEYVNNCYRDLEKEHALEISQDGDSKKFEIIRPWSFESIVEKTTQKFPMGTKRSIYIILLQNYLRSLKFEKQFEKALIFPEYYNNEKRKRKDQEVVFLRQEEGKQIATRFYAEGDTPIPIEARAFNLNDSGGRKTKEEYSKIIETISLGFMKEIFGVTEDKIIVQTGSSNKTTLKKALKEGFSVLFFHISPENFKNNVMRAIISGPRELDKRTFDTLKKLGIICIQINNPS